MLGVILYSNVINESLYKLYNDSELYKNFNKLSQLSKIKYLTDVICSVFFNTYNLNKYKVISILVIRNCYLLNISSNYEPYIRYDIDTDNLSLKDVIKKSIERAWRRIHKFYIKEEKLKFITQSNYTEHDILNYILYRSKATLLLNSNPEKNFLKQSNITNRSDFHKFNIKLNKYVYEK